MFKSPASEYLYLWDLLRLIGKKHRRNLLLVGVIQFLLSLLDLIGLLTIGVISSLGLSAINSTPVPSSLKFILNLDFFYGRSLEYVTICLALLTVIVLLAKTLSSAWTLRRIIGFLSVREAEVSSFYFRKLLHAGPSEMKGRSPQQVAGVALSAVNAGITVTLGQLTNLLVEVFSIGLLFVGISFVDLTVTLPAMFFFVTLGLVSTKLLKRRISEASKESYFLGISSSELIRNAIATSRELHVANQEDRIADAYATLRAKNYLATRRAAFASSLPKYVSEVGLILGGLFVTSTQILLKDAKSALVGMVLFLALSTRIIPSVLRIQTAFLEINGAKGAALDLLQDLAKLPATESIISAQSSHHVSFVEKEKAGNAFQASVLLRNVFADYGNQELFELKNINFEIQPGELLAIVGPSGGGKTSIVDVIVGAISVRSGEVLISNSPPEIAIGKWPTEIRYVSQDVYLLAGTLASNILWPNLNASFSEDALWNILEKLNLADWARSLPKGLYSNIETFGNNISGGQKQRIGIARALYSNPHLLIMDEATSSLDSTTERDISENVVRDLSGVTRIVIAHRLSTIRHADKILYIANGSIVHSGSFEQVRAAVPAFDIQAEISGI